MAKDPFAPIWLSFPLPAFRSALAFQACRDFCELPRYTRLGFADSMDGVVRYLGASAPQLVGGQAATLLGTGLRIVRIAPAWRKVPSYRPRVHGVDNQRDGCRDAEHPRQRCSTVVHSRPKGVGASPSRNPHALHARGRPLAADALTG